MHIAFERHDLSNGLVVLLAPDRHAPVVAVNLWYDVGSRNERIGKSGFAHLFEHMMFQGSQNVPDNEHFGQIERAGGSLNGSTWLDRTNYYETVPSHALELALWLESDRMGFLLPAMTQAKLDNQRDVVKNERLFRVDNQPYGDWDERIQTMIFPADHPYHHSVIGSMADLDAATLEDVSEFFRTYYAPSNATLSIAGDFEPAQALEWVHRYFGQIPRGPAKPPIPGIVNIPLRLSAPIREEVISDVPLVRSHVAYRIPPYGTPDFYAIDVATHLLAGGRSSRLYKALVKGRLSQDAVSYAFPVVTGSSFLVSWMTALPGIEIERIEAVYHDEVARLAAEGPTGAELTRAMRVFETRRSLGLQGAGERADQLSMFRTLFDAPELIDTEIERYRAVTAEDIKRVVGHHMAPAAAATLVYRPGAGA